LALLSQLIFFKQLDVMLLLEKKKSFNFLLSIILNLYLNFIGINFFYKTINIKCHFKPIFKNFTLYDENNSFYILVETNLFVYFFKIKK